MTTARRWLAHGSGRHAHGGPPAQIEATTAAGESRPLVFSVRLLADADGHAAGAVAVFRSTDEPVSFV